MQLSFLISKLDIIEVILTHIVRYIGTNKIMNFKP